MARPKVGVPPKRNMNLTVNENTRELLDFLSKHYEKSISALVAEWATEKEKEVVEEYRKREEERNSETDTNVARKNYFSMSKCFVCKHFGAAEIVLCHNCGENNNYKHWEKKK